ncbi:hypothetical protein [Formosa sp. PL04]|uniref:hypothetical protein n=1 Tax=Formosa sp. PL04 TaxID=3081755 RepID=UPI0029827467|nr:hypothetical protein [Formosa sp. PL04]MDW5289004.1 hypothetical protein [Formosa sp. PL04]
MQVKLEQKQYTTLEYKNYYLFILTIVLFYIGDAFRKLAFYFNWEFSKYTTLSKILCLILFFVFFVFNIKDYLNQNEVRKLLNYLVILVISFFVGQFALQGIDIIENVIVNLEFLVKYLFFPIILIVFNPLLKNIDLIKRLFKLFEIIFLLNIILIFYGFFTDFPLFRTYFYGDRIGFNGFFSKSGQVSYYFIILILVYYRSLIIKFELLIALKLFIVILASLLVGTKKVFLFFPIILIYHLFFENKKSKYLVLIGSLAVLIFVIFYRKIIGYFEQVFNLFYFYYKRDGFLSSLTSFRIDKLVDTLENFIRPHWSFLNYICGGGNFRDYRFLSGMDFIDLYFFLGVVGIFFFTKIYFNFIKLNFKDYFNAFFIFIIFSVSFFSSGLLYEPSVNLLFFLIVPIMNSLNSKKERL